MNSTTEWALGVWDGNDIEVDLDGLDVGIYFFRVVVNDTAGHSAEDTVLVTVVESSGFPIDITTLLIIAAVAGLFLDDLSSPTPGYHRHKSLPRLSAAAAST